MQYFLRTTDEKGNEILKEAIPERWVWAVLYKDDTELHQFEDDTGTFHQIKEIKHDQIKLAGLYNFNDPKRKIMIPWKEGMKFIHKYINVHSHVQHADDINATARVYVFGYKIGNEHHYTYILPNDWMIYSNEENIDLTTFPLT
jgi:hypothetical protein